MFTWKLSYCENRNCQHLVVRSREDIERLGFPVIAAEVPGNFELDMMRAGLLPDLYYSENTLLAQRLENFHLWYFTEFEVDEPDSMIHFEGVDTIADIYVNGELVGRHDNMFTAFDVSPAFRQGKNELVVHIKPAALEARRRELPPASTSMRYTFPTLALRKAASSFGWDIMPRIVSGGIWKPVTLMSKKREFLRNIYVTTTEMSGDRAIVNFHISADVEDDFMTDYSVRIRGVCREHSFECRDILWHTDSLIRIEVENPYLWWPKPMGDPNLYDTIVELYHGEELCDSYRLQVGIRQIRLITEDMEANGEGGEFCFFVNGKRFFALGTNWVPLDAFHSQDEKRLEQALLLLENIGCNMVRCWGGNVYESDAFYDFCDRKGILVWQDFAMGCGCYPNDPQTVKQLEEEAIYQIKRLRNHPSLALWAGDNECDIAANGWNGVRLNPCKNLLTREVLSRAVAAWDYGRDYLPSSPYVSEKSYRDQLPLPEDHLWGPRDYFKGDFYRNATCHFASETGYHGFPAVTSLSTFLKEPEKIFEDNGQPTKEYLVHAASMETSENAPFAYRIRLAYNQVEVLFGQAEEDLTDFVKQSQISQAEAKKYFVERFRIGKWRRTGIIWWNLLDGWPQISDAIVDYYFRKKLAYSYIKRSQNPVCLMMDEYHENGYTLCATNDLPEEVTVSYRVIDVAADTTLLKGSAILPADQTVRLDTLLLPENDRRFLLIEWKRDGKIESNHYVTNIKGCDYRWYDAMLIRCGFDEWEI